MKIRTKLCITFAIIILFPILITALVIYFFGGQQAKNLADSYGIEDEMYHYVPTSVQIASNMTRDKFEKLKKYAKSDRSFFDDMEEIEAFNSELLIKESYLILCKEDIPYYMGAEIAAGDSGSRSSEEREKTRLGEITGLENLLQELPGYGQEYDDFDQGKYFGNNMQILLKQVDFQFDDGMSGSAYIVTSLNASKLEMKHLLIRLLVLGLIVMLITSMAMVYWILGGFMKPIHNLKIAAQNIKEGNLDFTIEVRGKDEISELCADFEEMRKRLKDSVEEQMEHDRENKELISNISHDLKTPMTAVLGYVQGIRDGVADTPEKMERYMKTIYTKAMDMDRLINELTFYSKIDTNRIPYVFNELLIGDFFEDCVEESVWDLESKNIHLSYNNFLDHNIKIIADSEQLRRAINNIISNSVKYIDKVPGYINITLKDAGDFIQIEISDNGTGIAGKDLPYIFDRFYRTDYSRNSSKGGSGIGLSIVKKIIEEHGGKIWANSKEGVGTVMFIVLRKYEEVIGSE